MRRGNCYVASEAIYHTTGAANGPWRPQVMRLDDSETHWFLRHKVTGEVLDPSARQFDGALPDYSKGRGCGFLTREPSKRARALIDALTWQ